MKHPRATALLVFLVLTASAAVAEQRYSVSINDSPSTGPENAAVTIIEFLDFQ